LDGWLGRKNLLLLAASPTKPVELGELGELGDLGDLGDWKPNFFLSFPVGNDYQFYFFRVSMRTRTQPVCAGEERKVEKGG
jgi:hypothetical protein